MITFILSDDHLCGCKWSKNHESIQIQNVSTVSFKHPITHLLHDEKKLTNQISIAFQTFAQDIDLSGDEITVLMDQHISNDEVLQVDEGLPHHIPNQYIEWHKDVALCDVSDAYGHFVSGEYQHLNEYQVTYFPSLLPDIVKLSLREMGGYPYLMASVSQKLMNGWGLENVMAVHDTIHGYDVIGKTTSGTFYTTIKFLRGAPKFSDWSGSTQIRDELFTDQLSQETIHVKFLGNMTDNQKAHWFEHPYFVEHNPSFEIEWSEECNSESLNGDDKLMLEEILLADDDGSITNLFDVSQRSEPSIEEEFIVRKKTEPSVEKPVDKRKSPNGIITFIYVILGMYYIFLNSDYIVSFAEHYINPDQVITTTEITVPSKIEILYELSRQHNSFLSKQLNFDQSFIKTMVVSGSDVHIKWKSIPDDLQLRFDSQIDIEQESDNLSIRLEESMSSTDWTHQKPMQSWIQFTYKKFPNLESHIFNPIPFEYVSYYPVTVKLSNSDEIFGFVRWLKNGPDNVMLRKSVITNEDEQVTALFYISVFDILGE